MTSEETEWPTFFNKAWSDIQGRIKSRLHDRLSRGLLDQKRTIELKQAVARRNATREFLEGYFWTEYLMPLLAGEQSLKPWREGESLRPDEISSKYLFSSGKAVLAESILKTFDMWIRKGDEAEHALAEDEKKRKVLTTA